MMKYHNLRYVTLFLTSLSAGFAQIPALSVGSGAAQAGSSIELPIVLTTQTTRVAGVQWTLSYTPAVFPVITATAGPAAISAGKSLDCVVATPGQYRCIVSGLDSASITDGTVASVTLSVNSSASATSSPLIVPDAIATDPDGSGMMVAAADGAVAVTPVATVSALICNPVSVIAPGSAVCTVTLNTPAPLGGLTVFLGSASAQNIPVTMPSFVSFPTGSLQSTFTVQVPGASGSGSLILTASANGNSRTVTLNVAGPASLAITVSPSAVTVGPSQTQQFVAAVSGTTNTAVSWSLSSGVGTISSAGVYTAPTIISAPQTVTIRAVSAADTSKFATATLNLVPPVTSPTTVSFWQETAVPATVSSDTQAVEVGMKFYSDVPGTVKGIRFYKGPGNGGVHIGTLWSASGAKLATVTFTTETATGWQTASFATPVKITPRTDYTISYFAPLGQYSQDTFYFGTQLDRGMLHSASGANGVYAYGTQSRYPTRTWSSSNYWVDVVFSPSEVEATAVSATITAGTLTSGTAVQLEAVDNLNLVVKSTTMPPYTAEFYATFGGVPAFPSALTIGYVGKSSRACVLTTSAFNWMSNEWVQLDSRAVGTSKATIPVIPVPGTLVNFVNSTSGRGDTRIKVGCSSPTGNMTLTVDQLVLSYAQ